MPITIICPNLRCRSVLQIPEHARGQKVRCAHCGRNLLVPEKKIHQTKRLSTPDQKAAPGGKEP